MFMMMLIVVLMAAGTAFSVFVVMLMMMSLLCLEIGAGTPATFQYEDFRFQCVGDFLDFRKE